MGTPTMANARPTSPQGHGAAGETPEEAGQGEDEDELDPFGGLEMHPAGKPDPAPGAEVLGADEEDGQQGGDADEVGGAGDVDEAVVIDERDEEHEGHAEMQKADLLMVKAVKLGHRGGRANFENADQRKQGDEAEKDPVEVAESGEAHGPSPHRGVRAVGEAATTGRAALAASGPGRGGLGWNRPGGFRDAKIASLFALFVDVGVDDLRGEAGGVEALIAVLPQHGDDDIGIAPGGYADEPGVGERVVAFAAAGESVMPDDLRGPGLPGRSRCLPGGRRRQCERRRAT